MRTHKGLTAVALAGALVGGSVGGAAVVAQAAPSAAPAAASVAHRPAPKPAPGTAFTAYSGTWRAVVSRGVLRVEGGPIGTRTAKVSRSAFSKGVEFTGKHKGRNIGLVVRSGRCIDTAGKNTGMRATLFYGKKQVRGCAVAGALPIANT